MKENKFLIDMYLELSAWEIYGTSKILIIIIIRIKALNLYYFNKIYKLNFYIVYRTFFLFKRDTRLI